MTTIVTVHGTNAGDESDTGDQWWQQGSEFQNKLSEYVEAPDGHLEFKPFHWGVGPNSELKRRDAGNDLRRTMLELEKEEEPYAVIGHSHGGSVLNHALFSVYAKNLSLPKMKSWVTVGTPFIRTVRDGWFFSRFNTVGKMGLIIASAFFVAALIYIADMLRRGHSFSEYADALSGNSRSAVASDFLMFTIVNIAIGVGIVLLARAYGARGRKRNSPYHQNSFLTQFRERWFALSHPRDEAINGLSGVVRTEVPLFQATSLAKGIAPILALATVILCTANDFLIRFTGQPVISGSFFDLYESLQYFLMNLLLGFYANLPHHNIFTYNLALVSEAIIAGPALPLAFGTIIWLIILYPGRYVLFPITILLNGLVTGGVRKKAFGADSYGERVEQVSYGLTSNENTLGEFPAALADEIERYTEQYAIDAIRKIRALIGSNIASSDNPITDQISDTLSWKELIHTAYFDIDNFTKLVAVSLCEAGLVAPSEKLKNDPEYDTVVGWYREMRPAISA
ncbi:MAG: hypothetical protein MRY59_13010 [Aquisalinus sp.]|nr:hypothetical protein [Aquisalinus sp.]